MGFDRRANKTQAAAKRVIRRIDRIEAAAAASQHELSSWERDFLSDVKERLTRHGRAFSDPEKGSPGAALSTLQVPKLWQIQKAVTSGDAEGAAAPKKRYSTFRSGRGGFGRRRAGENAEKF